MIDFKRGHPNLDLLPVDSMKQVLQQLLCVGVVADEPDNDLLSCLNYPNARNDNGNPELLHELSLFLNEQTKFDDTGSASGGVRSTSDNHNNHNHNHNNGNDFFMTHGVSHAIDLLCGTLTERGNVVCMESPTYFLVAHIFQQHGLILQSLPMMKNQTNKDNNNNSNDGNGHGRMDVKRFAEMLSTGEMVPPRLVYTIPTNHNPTGATLPVEDRILLAQLAEHYQFYVIADEVYHLLDWKDAGQRPARMATFNNNHSNNSSSSDGYCISVSSFTKIFAPGVRCGWIEGPQCIIQQLSHYGYIVSQGGCLPFMGHVMRMALQKGICTSVLTTLQHAYQERATLLCQILDTCPDIIITVRPSGGYFLWIQLPCHATAFAAYTEKHGVKILPGTICDPFSHATSTYDDKNIHNTIDHCARLCFADLSLADLEQGAHDLIRLLSEYQTESAAATTTITTTKTSESP